MHCSIPPGACFGLAESFDEKKIYCSVCDFFSNKIFVSLVFRLFGSLQQRKRTQHKIITAPWTQPHPWILHIKYFHGKRGESATISSFWSRNFRCVENACGRERCIIAITLLFTTDRLHNIFLSSACGRGHESLSYSAYAETWTFEREWFLFQKVSCSHRSNGHRSHYLCYAAMTFLWQ